MVQKIKASKRTLGLLLALCILTAALPFSMKTQVSAAPTEVAGDIVVTSTADSGAGSLREAVAAAAKAMSSPLPNRCSAWAVLREYLSLSPSQARL